MNSSVKSIIEDADKCLSKDLGKGILTTLSSGAIKGIPVIPSGIPQLDVALGVGGVPRGRIIEIYGNEGSGKTTTCLKIIAQAQMQGGDCGMVDAEHAFDPAWAQLNGVDTDNLIISQPDSGEDAFTVAEFLIDKGCSVVLIDSVSALVPRAELDGQVGDSFMGLQARMMGQAMRKLVGKVSKSKCILIFTNQLRQKIGIVFGNPNVTSGGNALKFYASIRMECAITDKIKGVKEKVEKADKGKVVVTESNAKEDKDAPIIGNKIRIKIIKNKVAPPFKVCEAIVSFDKGLHTPTNLFSCMLESGKIKKAGAWYSIDGDQLGAGKEASIGVFEGLSKLGDFYDEYVQGKLNSVEGSAISDEEQAEIDAIRKRKELKKKAKLKNA